MRVGSLAVALVLLLAGAGTAAADTMYTLARVNADIFAINPADIVDAGGGRKTATFYFIRATHQADAYVTEFDCAGGRLITQSQRIVRSDLSLVRNVKRAPAWEKPDPKAVGGIVLKFVCDWPSPPVPAESTAAESTAAFLLATADNLLARTPASGRDINPDRTTVGDCIFSQMPKDVSTNALIAAQGGRSPAEDKAFRDRVKTLGAKCSGRPESDSDMLVITAGLSIYMRFGSIARLTEKSKITENHLAAAWNSAAPSVRAPLLERAAMMNTSATVSDVQNAPTDAIQASVRTLMETPVLAGLLAEATNLNDAPKRILVSQYFMAVAMGEQAEAALAPQAAAR
jgi:hypothetical protein